MNRVDINRVGNQAINTDKKLNVNKNKTKKDFNQVLNDIKNKNNDIKFSKHASKRRSNRNIDISNKEIERLEDAFKKANANGIKDALILMDNKAFIANIKNKTIITSVEKEALKQNVFTNIDGAVII